MFSMENPSFFRLAKFLPYFLTFDEQGKQKVGYLQSVAKTAIPVKISKQVYYDHL
jgi:hypothetical protein